MRPEHSKQLRDNIWSHEIECQCGCGLDKVTPGVLDIAQGLREHFGKPIIMNTPHCGVRCEKHNAAVGGSKTSQHLPDEDGIGHAIDIEVQGVSTSKIYDYLNWKYPDMLGLGIYNTFVHVDDRKSRAFRWDKRS